MLRNSWAEFFATEVFPNINEERFSVLYSSNHASRPNNPVNVYVGLLLLREMNDQSDEEAISSLIFDLRYQYALHTTSMEEQPVSKNSLSNFRAAVLAYYEKNNIDLIQQEVEALAPHLKKLIGIDGLTKRMDSMMVSSSCQKLSRLELFYSVVSRMIHALDKANKDLLPQSLKRYLESGHRNDIIYRARNTDITSKFAVLLEDALLLKEIIVNTHMTHLEEYELFDRFLREQTVKSEDGKQLMLSTEIRPDSLQNPTDPDATYHKKCNKSFIGYTANLLESTGNGTAIVEHYDFKPNTYNDQQFTKDIVKTLGKQPEGTKLIVDGAFYSFENFRIAAANHINLMPTNMNGQKIIHEKPLLTAFEIDLSTLEVKRCPALHAPIISRHNKGRIRAHFDKKTCMNCPKLGQCPVSRQKKSFVLDVTDSLYHRYKMMELMGTESYQQTVRIRAGIEGTPSALRRKYRVDTMPVMGLLRSKIWFGLKLGALNIKRAMKWIKGAPNFDVFTNLINHLLEVCNFQRAFLSILSAPN